MIHPAYTETGAGRQPVPHEPDERRRPVIDPAEVVDGRQRVEQVNETNPMRDTDVARVRSVAAVRMKPGLMVLARILCGAPSIASCRVIASTPPLPAQ